MNALRAWDIAHPRLWGASISERRVPWGGSETITPGENLEEIIMLGIRLREGLDIGRVNRAVGALPTPHAFRPLRRADVEPLIADGLIEARGDGRIVATRRGRLLNDAVIERLFDLIGV